MKKKKKTPGEKERERERLPWFSTTNMKWDTFPSDPESTIPSLLSSLFELDVRNKKCGFISLSPSLFRLFLNVQYRLCRPGRQAAAAKSVRSQTPPTRHDWEYKTI